jgi:hypothetical protein
VDITELITSSPSGGTVSLAGDELPGTGYFVGGLVSPLIIEPGDSPAYQRDALETFASYLVETVGAEYLGWWTDEDTDKLWVDGTTWHETEFEAGRAGRRRREIAVYDIARQRELRLAYVEGE